MELHIEPAKVTSWRDFTFQTGAHSIALDGFVPEGPRFNAQGPWANFNHHEEVSRLETRATCAQVLIALRMGLMQTFDPEQLTVCVNDCDEDVCLSVFLLRDCERTSRHTDYRLNRLVFMEDMLDTTGGAYAFQDNLTSLHQLLWVFEPYHQFRVDGRLGDLNAEEYRGVIDSVGARILAHLQGDESCVEPDLRFEEMDRYGGLIMVREIGANARLGIYESGITHFISVREISGGLYSYTLARSSQFVPFPIPKILKALNQQEIYVGREAVPCGTWGGSDMVAGSPREGSYLTPDRVMRTIYKCIHS